MPIMPAAVLRLAMAAAGLVAGCVPAATVPLRTVDYGHAAAAAAPGEPRRLVIFLPGRGDRAEAFESQGFVAAARERRLRADLVAVNAHLGYYTRRLVVERLWADVVAPARARGYEQIWIVGISMGGLGAVALAREHPEGVTGAVLLAPYLGGDDVVEEITAAGGLGRWSPPGAPDDYRKLWQWLRGYATLPAGPPALWLGAGDLDRYATTHRLVAAVLPRERVLTVAGGHDWDAWRALWKELLAREFMEGARAAAGPAATAETEGCYAGPAGEGR